MFWWGVGLLRNPESFLQKTTEPWSRLPTWAVIDEDPRFNQQEAEFVPPSYDP